ncbi:hypothetical protein IAR55_000499 [Kwoniella newhampshirensis]|uniref:Nickel/cobalt efflux system n=1 Tax=Kwoniella newhampshirensis TaxID=1651941 RepID=A0AAW0Z6S4_9TREE
MIIQWLKTRRSQSSASPRKLTLLGRAIALITGELIANAACWIAAGICLSQADGLIGLALLAWTIGLRHGLDADHISAIDNATRQLVSLGQLPITCGLFFSLGHSTIVITVNVAIAISVSVYDKLDTVGSIGGIVGTSVSASFLFLIACINIYFLVGTIKQRRSIKRRQALGLPPDENDADPSKIYGGGCLVRIIAPVLKAVDRPWKMYPVGVLFGFGFDTASSIALLAISAIAQRGPHGEAISHGKIVIFPFTAGMSLVDSLDSILMLYAYATPSRSTREGKIALLQEPEDRKVDYPVDTMTITMPSLSSESLTARQVTPSSPDSQSRYSAIIPVEEQPEEEEAQEVDRTKSDMDLDIEGHVGGEESFEDLERSAGQAGPSIREERIVNAKANTMSSLSIILTLLSILVALSIAIIEIMGLIGENCTSCQAAANDPEGGGLAGKWWRGWARANDQSGYIGAAIVGCFVAILLGWYGGRWVVTKYMKRKEPLVPVQGAREGGTI